MWYGVDPLAEKAPAWTPYRYGFNNPIRYNDPTGTFEFDSYDSYKKHQTNTGGDILTADKIGSQGHWLTSDRKNNTSVWDQANEYNIKNNNIGQYKPFEQVGAFYNWVNDRSADKGNDVKWMEGAKGLVQTLVMNREFGGENFIGNDIIKVLETLNVAIADATLPYFNELLYSGKQFKGEDAYKWDVSLVTYEQGIIAAQVYNNMNKSTLNRFNAMANGKDSKFGYYKFLSLFNYIDFGKYGKNVWDTKARIDIPLNMLYGNKHKVR